MSKETRVSKPVPPSFPHKNSYVFWTESYHFTDRRIRKKDISAPFNFVANKDTQSPDDLAHPQTVAWEHAESSPEDNFFSLTQVAQFVGRRAGYPQDKLCGSRLTTIG